MPRPGRDEDRVAGADSPRYAVHGHFSAAFEDEIKLLAQQMVVGLGRSLFRQTGLREALMLDRSIRRIQNAANSRTVLCRKWLLFRDI